MESDRDRALDALVAKLTDPRRRPCMASFRYPDGASVFCDLHYGHGPLPGGACHNFPKREEITRER